MENAQLTAELESAIPAIMARVRRESEQRIEEACLRAVMEVATREANSWAAEVLAPEIRAQLEAGKDSMLTKAVGIADRLCEAVSDALVKNVEKSLATSYNVKAIADVLFRGY